MKIKKHGKLEYRVDVKHICGHITTSFVLISGWDKQKLIEECKASQKRLCGKCNLMELLKEI